MGTTYIACSNSIFIFLNGDYVYSMLKFYFYIYIYFFNGDYVYSMLKFYFYIYFFNGDYVYSMLKFYFQFITLIVIYGMWGR